MRLETLPIVAALLIGIAGLALVADAAIPDGIFIPAERRRVPRPARNLWGEGALGVGVLLVAAALAGRDSWRYSTLAVLGAFVLIVVGVTLNWRYVRGLMFGPAAPPDETAAPPPAPPPGQERRLHPRSRVR